MKKLYFLAMAFLFTALSYGQVFLYEDFSSNIMPPDGWSIDGVANKWSVSASNNAGSEAPEAKFTYISQNTTSRLISPIVDLTGIPNATIFFKHFYDHYAAGVTIGVATRIATGGWDVVWQLNPTGNVGPKTQIVDLTGVSQSDF